MYTHVDMDKYLLMKMNIIHVTNITKKKSPYNPKLFCVSIIKHDFNISLIG